MQDQGLKISMSGKKRPKILFVSHWAQRLGGAEISLLDIMSEACKKADVFLVCSENGILVESAKTMGIDCRIINCNKQIENIRRDKLIISLVSNFKALFCYFCYIFQLYRYVVKLKPDIIHANIPKSHIAIAILSRFYRDCTFVFHLREIFKTPSVPVFLYSFLLPGSRCMVIAISDAVKNTLPLRIKKRIQVLYNGIKIPGLMSQKSQSENPAFLYLGRVVPWKGCHLLIEAYSLLYQKTGDRCGSLDLVGDTLYWDQSYRNDLLNKISLLNLSGKVRLLPHTSDPSQLYLSHDILCMASDNEPFGRVAIEAMSYGLPVISFESGGISEIITHGTSGFLVPQNDIRVLADAMEKFILDPELITTMGRAGYDIANRNFNSEKNIPLIIDSMIDLLE